MRIFWSVVIATILMCCTTGKNKPVVQRLDTDTLRVGMLYSPTTFFMFRGDTMGYEYERVANYAIESKTPIKYIIAQSTQSLVDLLEADSIDLIASEIPITHEYKQRVLHCGTENITHQVLVQHKDSTKIETVTQLVGKKIYVEKGSKYEARLRNLDSEIGGGIKIITISEDTLITEDLISQVADGEIPLTVVDSDIAKLNKTYYPNLDISVEISFSQRSSWAVKKDNTHLANRITKWSNLTESKYEDKIALKRYFELSKNEYSEFFINTKSILSKRKGIISNFDNLFKENALRIGWDWRRLAAIGWVESKFNKNVVSWSGSIGVMQLMPRTGKKYGLSPADLKDEEKCISAAASYLAELDNIFSKNISDEKERIKFVLAAYNAGYGHILDAIALAKKYHKDPTIWDGNVAEALLWKSKPEFFNDKVCKNGYFRGKITIAYVKNVTHYYNYYTSKIKN